MYSAEDSSTRQFSSAEMAYLLIDRSALFYLAIILIYKNGTKVCNPFGMFVAWK